MLKNQSNKIYKDQNISINEEYISINICLKIGIKLRNDPWHGISNNVVCATSKASDLPAHTRSLIRAFASGLHILGVLSY